MSKRTQRNQHRKYTSSTQENIFFVLVILLAAALYSHHISDLNRGTTILNISLSVAVIVGLAAIVLLLMKLRHAKVHHFSQHEIDNMSGIEFEKYVAKLLPRRGYTDIKLTEHYDLGLDIIAEKDGLLWGIQVKRYKSTVKMAAVRQVVAAIKHYGCDRSMVIANNSFSSPAQVLAESNHCVLVDRAQLLSWETKV